MTRNVGSRLGHYDVTALIGEAGMGQVYQATDTKLNRQVALKILPEASLIRIGWPGFKRTPLLRLSSIEPGRPPVAHSRGQIPSTTPAEAPGAVPLRLVQRPVP